MLGVADLERRLAKMSDSDVASWLERGLRMVAGKLTSETVELAFSPLMLSPTELPMEQFHSAVDQLPDWVEAQLRRACGLLLGSIRSSDAPPYLQKLWALAAALLPPSGAISPAQRTLFMIRSSSLAHNEATPAIIDSIVTTILGYELTNEQLIVLDEIRGSGYWRPSHTDQQAKFLASQAGRGWPKAITPLVSELQPLVKKHPFLFKRLSRSIGHYGIASNMPVFTRNGQYFWLWEVIKDFVSIKYRGDRYEIDIDGDIGHVPFSSLPVLNDEETVSIHELIEQAEAPEVAIQLWKAALLFPAEQSSNFSKYYAHAA